MGTISQFLEMTEEGVPPQLTRADDYRVLATTAFALAARHKSMAKKHIAQENKEAAAVYWKLFDEAVGIGHQYLVLAEFAEGKLRNPHELKGKGK